MLLPLVIVGLALAGAFIGVGIFIEMRGHGLRPTVHTESAEFTFDGRADITMEDIQRQGDLSTEARTELVKFVERMGQSVQSHPAKALGVIETVFWAALLLPLIDNLLDPQGSTTAFWTWLITIGPHEIGHLLFMPFGELLMYLGGSIFQVLFFVLIGSYVLLLKRQVTSGIFFFMVAGHSFINISVYIRDASTRRLDLLFGLDKSHHDWWNILRRLDMLAYDGTIADIVLFIGAVVVLGTLIAGILTTWMLPRTHFGKVSRFGNRTATTPQTHKV